MICHTNHALDQFLELTVNRLNITDGIIRVGNRCQNPAIQRFSLIHARRFTRENRLIPGNIYHQKHTIMDRKTNAEEALKHHEHKMVEAQNHILKISTLIDDDIIDGRHQRSLLAPFNGRRVETILTEWLGIDFSFEQQQQLENSTDLNDVEQSMSTINLSENGETEKVEQKQEQEESEVNEEEEEEQRRRDELEMEEENFATSTVKTSEVTSLPVEIAKETEILVDADGFQMVRRKPQDRRRLIREVIQYPTTLTDETIVQINDDVWSLPIHERRDLYRYWLYKYYVSLHYSVRDARNEYNQAVAALAEYHQEEDYYILKDSVIVAMTTTCAAKYHHVLEKLRMYRQRKIESTDN